MRDDDIDALVDDLAERLGRAISVEDRRWRLVAYSAQDEGADRVRQASILQRRASPDVVARLDGLALERSEGPVDVPADDALGMGERTCVPLRDGGVLLGFLWVLGILRGEARAVAADAAPALGAALGARRRAEDAMRAALSGRFGAALGGDAEAGRALAADAGWTGPVVVAVVHGPGDAVERVRRRWPAGRLVRLEGQSTASHVAAPGAPPALAAALVAAGAERAAASRPTAPGDLRAALGQAEAADAAARADERLGPAVAYEALGAWGPIATLWLAAGRPAYDGPLSMLDDEQAAVLELVLESHDVSAAAAALHLHRATLYRRLERIEQRTGLDLGRGDDRLQAHLGLRLRRLSSRAR